MRLNAEVIKVLLKEGEEEFFSCKEPCLHSIASLYELAAIL